MASLNSLPFTDSTLRTARAVKLAVFDVDGVLTDGGLLYSAEGESLKRFDVRDGLGLKLLMAADIAVAIISARDSKPLRKRLKDLGVEHATLGCSTKHAALTELTQELGLELSQVAYTGDDLVDLPALQAVGFPIAVANAHRLLKDQAVWTTERRGGDGAVREIAEALIGAQQDFDSFVADYLQQRTSPPARQEAGFSVVIPARFASSRLPGKPLLNIAGKPMIQHVCENALSAGAQEVIVATDDLRIHQVVTDFGGQSVMTSADHVSGTDRIAEVATKGNWSDERIVVNLQGDEPLLQVGLIRLVARLLGEHPEAGLSTLATPIHAPVDLFDPNVVKVVVESSGLAQYFSRAPIPWVRDAFAGRSAQEIGELPSGVPFLRHLGLYAYRTGTLKRMAAAPKSPLEEAESLEQLRALQMGIRIAVGTVTEPPGHGVDTPADLERVEQEFARRKTEHTSYTEGSHE